MALLDSGGHSQLPIINYSKLAHKDISEVARLFRACEIYGFFYLTLDVFMEGNHQKLLDFMREYFSQDLELKMHDDRKSDTCGYEPVETSAGAVHNRKDFYESLKVPRTELRSQSTTLPEGIIPHLGLFDEFSTMSHEIVMTILALLSDSLGLSDDVRLERYHRDDYPTTSTLSMFHYPKQTVHDKGIGHNKHTDLGTLTFLLCEEWGLQVLSPDTDMWQFVPPKPGHAIINVGDSLRFLAENRFCSAVHRVMPIGDRQEEDRYSIAYFLRPENDVRYQDSQGRTVKAKEWHDEKFDVFRVAHEVPVQNEILTGGMEKNNSLLVRKYKSDNEN